MLFRPFLLLVRKRLIATASLSLVVAILAVRIDDVRTLFFFGCIFIGGFIGWTSAPNSAAEIRFLFTRPIPRLTALLRPLGIGCFAVVLFPLVTFLLMLGMLYLGAGRSRLHVLATIDLARAYRLDVALSLAVYTIMALERWQAFSKRWIRSLGFWLALLFLNGIVWFRPWLLSRGAGLVYLLLAVTFIVGAFGWLYGPWRVLRGIDELTETGHLTPTVDMADKIRALQAARTVRPTE